MTHHISGFIGPTEHLKNNTKDLSNAEVILLTQGMSFLPLNEDLYKEINYTFHKNLPMKWLVNRFRSMPFVWIETDYFGGSGTQSAIIWQNGKKKRLRSVNGNNIDNALKLLGVKCDGNMDEFDTLGLGNYRTNEEWVKQ